MSKWRCFVICPSQAKNQVPFLLMWDNPHTTSSNYAFYEYNFTIFTMYDPLCLITNSLFNILSIHALIFRYTHMYFVHTEMGIFIQTSCLVLYVIGMLFICRLYAVISLSIVWRLLYIAEILFICCLFVFYMFKVINKQIWVFICCWFVAGALFICYFQH